MDIVLNYLDEYLLSRYNVYPESWPEDYWLRQAITLFVVVNVGGAILYFLLAGLSYQFIYDHRLMQHPKFLKNQIQREILYTLKSIPFMGVLTVIMFMLEVKGYSQLYDSFSESKIGWLRLPWEILSFLFFTDMCIYWIHRWLHHPAIYKHLHKAHHLWKVPTPFASHAFHPVDGFLQSFPYHLYPFFFPLHKGVYLFMFVFVNFWTVSIHDGDYRVPDAVQPFINGSAHHTDHHLFYNYNYGQFFTLWDRLGGSFRNPSAFEGNGPMEEVLKLKEKNGSLAKKQENGSTAEELANGISQESGYNLRKR
ncbi:lathosterol oxidase-like [Diadema setosum]|uniref:lathosterol oxidase-like n=1 Tax=Diadema setosum TaxID=31175 RepID=UPI003B3ADA18